MPGLRGIRLRNPRPPDHLQPRVEHAGIHSLLETLVHVAHLPELSLIQLDSTFFCTRPASRPMNRLSSAIERSLSRSIPLLMGGEFLQPAEFKKPQSRLESSTHCRRSEESPPILRKASIRAVTNHLAAQAACDHGMLFEILQHALRIEPRIGIVESGDESQRDDVIFAAVNPRTAVFFGRKRPAQSVDDSPARRVPKNFPKLFHANTVSLRLASRAKSSFDTSCFVNEPRGPRRNRDFGVKVITRFEVRF